ncbi:MAG: Crp/Fnr family transcriptional regulator [Paludibacteraceae bacterium]|nr:Crp/Fnr family transcriptional regulator [Paludibacteraceae bacterium]MBR4840521.1 Crp/Fnr family transcriptional regulator [Paludibacteraceae bacterium]
MKQQKVDLDFLKACFKAKGVNEGSKEMFEEFASKIEVFSIKKYSVLSKEGDVWGYIGLVKSGILRTYYIKNGKDVTEGFVPEGREFTSLASLYSQKESCLLVAAEEDTIYYRMSYEDIEKLCIKYPAFDLFFQQSMAYKIKMFNIYFEILHLDSADERFNLFSREFPNVVSRVPSIHLATCLGITPETLSRVKSRRYK